MASDKQVQANKQNALASTGAQTQEGKAIVAQNAIKHGIFAKDIIISSGDGKEDEKGYFELLTNLVESLNPKGQMETLLVEKIAVDFWRLKRVLRFETGSIRQCIDTVIYDYYHKTNFDGEKYHKTNEELDEEISQQRELTNWNNRYIKALDKGKVKFDKPVWEGDGLESEIEDDLYMVVDANKAKILNELEYRQFTDSGMEFEELKKVLNRAEFTDKDISKELIECYKKQNVEYQKKVGELEQEKLKNKYSEEVNIKTSNLPSIDKAEKIIKYEKAIQKSILQNLALLKRLQSCQ